MKWTFPLLLGVALAGCATDPTTTFSGVLTAYAGGLAAENVYLTSGKATPEVAAQILKVNAAAHAVLAPIEAEIAAGQAPTSNETLAAQAAVSALTTYLTSEGIQ